MTRQNRSDSPGKRSARSANQPSDNVPPGDENKYRDFIEKLPVLLYALEPDPPYTPIYVSPAFEIFGYSVDEWLNDPKIWTRVIHKDDQARVFDETVESTRTGENAQYEYRVIAADGTVH